MRWTARELLSGPETELLARLLNSLSMQHRQAKDAGSRTDPVTPASVPETMDFVEREKLYGLSCGKVGMTLLASPLITPGATL